MSWQMATQLEQRGILIQLSKKGQQMPRKYQCRMKQMFYDSHSELNDLRYYS